LILAAGIDFADDREYANQRNGKLIRPLTLLR
jgi:hypothetical protein